VTDPGEEQRKLSAAPITHDAVLEVEDLHVAFGGVRAVDGATFTVPRGELTALIGPNGAGKTTVLNVIAGAQKPNRGNVRYEGAEITGSPPHEVARHGIARTFQLSSEFGRLTVLENLLVAVPRHPGASFWGALRPKRSWRRAEFDAVDRARSLLARFSMADSENKYAAELSGGQKRLVEIMRTLMNEPRLLLLDEPLAGVNPTLIRKVEDALTSLRREGLTILMIEHELGAVERLSDSVIVMARGTVLTRGSMEELRRDEEVISVYLAG
jgi:ABC-type branched-subunit amino acid transport system ATPase component